MRALAFVLLFALSLYAVLDCARTPQDSLPARLPKALWILVIVLFTGVGPIAWIISSRVKAAEDRGGVVEGTVWSSQESIHLRRPERPQTRLVAPDDDPEFLRKLDADLRRQKAGESKNTEDACDSDSAAPDGTSGDSDARENEDR